MTASKSTLRIAAMADLHYDKANAVSYRSLFEQIPERADVLLLGGDLTDFGLVDEIKLLLADLQTIRIPVLTVLGNHDYEAGQEAEISKHLVDAGIKVLDGHAVEIQGVGFAGAKGFAGGFGVHTLEPWGERIVKQFVQAALEEVMKLEVALSRLRTSQRIALLHYSPIAATVEGEPPAIYPYLGSSRLEEPLNRYRVQAVFHGHAHRGALEGKTREGIPVYNVSLPLLKRLHPDDLPVHIVEIPLQREDQDAGRAQ